MNTHIVPRKTYYYIWLGLMALLFLTWGLAQINLGPFNIVAMLSIALIKMLMVVLVFMHVKYSPRLLWVFVAAGFMWLAIMIDLTLSDYLTRGVVPGFRQTWRHTEARPSTPSGPNRPDAPGH